MAASSKRIFSLIVCIIYVSTVCISCADEHTAEPLEGQRDRAERIIEPGKLHNEILAEFNSDDVFVKGRAIETEEFISRMMLASNTVLRNNDIDYRVARSDIRELLNRYSLLARSGIFDAFKPVSARDVDDVYRLLNYLQHDASYDAEEIGKVRAAIEEIDATGIQSISKRDIQGIIADCKSSDRSSESFIALDVLEHSFTFWSDLRRRAEGDIFFTEEARTSRESVEPPMLGVDWYSINILLWDACGALLCSPGGPVASIICAVFVSAMYVLGETWDD
jgi:hypothetical protein